MQMLQQMPLGLARDATQSMANQTHIQCGCGSKLNTDNQKLIDAFDLTHGSKEHQDKVLEIKLLKVKNNG